MTLAKKDLTTNINFSKYLKSMYGIAACHDGTLYKYKTVGELNEPMLESTLDLLSEMKDYDNKYEKILTIFKDGGIEMEVL